MNRVTRFFYERGKKARLKEAESIGLRVENEERFDAYCLSAAKKGMLWYGLLFFLAAYLIYVRVSGG